MDSVTLIPIGRRVMLISGDGDIEGVVVGIQIAETGVQYRVAWWNGRTREEDWLYPFEIKDREPLSLKIGFSPTYRN